MPVEIPLARGYVAIVDDEDAERVKAIKWSAIAANPHRVYARSEMGIKGKRIRFLLHRFVLGLGPDDDMVDHINGNGLDNRKSNLRLCTNAENQRNRVRLAKDNKSGAVGVYWHKRKKKWGAAIGYEMKTIQLGMFDSKDDAVSARREAERIYFGEFAPAPRGHLVKLQPSQ